MDVYHLVLSAVLALTVCWVSGNLNGRYQHRPETVTQQVEILTGQPLHFDGHIGDLPEFHNRVLIPALIVLSARTHVGSLQQWFMTWRLIAAWIMFMVFIWATRSNASPWPTVGCTFLVVALLLSFGHPWEHPTDFPDVAFAIGFSVLTLSARYWPTLALAIVAAANRESAAFAGVIWVCVQGRGSDGRIRRWDVIRGGVMSVIAYGEVVLLRRRFGVPGSQRPQFMGITELSSKVRAFFDHPTPYSWPMLYIATGTPLLLLLWMLRSQVSRPESRLLVAACVMLAISLVFGEVTEPRVFLPIFAIPIYVITVAGSRIGLAGTSFRDVDGIRGIDRAVEIP